jgi:hypothetical protein
MKEDMKDEKKGRGGIGGTVLDESEESAKTWSTISPSSFPVQVSR